MWILLAALANAQSLRLDTDPQALATGGFRVELHGTEDRGYLQIMQGGAVRFDTPPGEAFLLAARDATSFHESRGMISIEDGTSARCGTQSVDAIEQLGSAVRLSGELACPGGPVTWTLQVTAVDIDNVRVVARTSDPTLDRLGLRFASTRDEAFLGFGEQFTHLNMKGRRLPIVVSEQGIGRGKQPLTALANLAAGAGGAWWTSYASVPHFVTSRMRSLALENHEPSVFDLRRSRSGTVEVHAPELIARVYAGDTPLELITAHTGWAGRMKALPSWAHSGAIIGLQGGTARTREALATLQGAGTPVAAFWLQDWVGQRVTSFGKQLWWSWTLDEQRYPEWDALVRDLDAAGVAVMTYINPFLVDVSERDGDYRNLYAEARDRGLFVDKDGAPYPLTNTDFDAGLLDLTDPDARAWAVTILQQELAGVGAKGWMADFGEAQPFDAQLYDGDPLVEHNRYPERWAQVNAEALDGLPEGHDMVFFMRSAYTRSPASASLFWLGDQMVAWDGHDGLRTALTGLLSSGISGFALNHSDIGGYTTLSSPVLNYHRSKELFQRWAELNAFTAVFRTHEGNQPENNHQWDSDADTLAHFSDMARLFACLAPERSRLMVDVEAFGWPIVRHPWLHYPGEAVFLEEPVEQFMLGADVMVAPVLRRGARRVWVRFPQDEWVHIWSHRSYSPGEYMVEAPIGQPAAFVRAGSQVQMELGSCLR